MCRWTVDLEEKGFPIAAAQQAAKAFNLKRRERAVYVPGVNYENSCGARFGTLSSRDRGGVGFEALIRR
eukprot:scaffold41050_cov65-Phaeocystis_antarctica.AAC.1